MFCMKTACDKQTSRLIGVTLLYHNTPDEISLGHEVMIATDSGEASACAVRAVYSDIHVSGCWFHYGRTIVKRLT